MTEIAISVSNVSKWFNTAQQPEGFRESISRRLKGAYTRQPAHGFWALKDVSFEVPRGEVLGLIGHNGAGKSVLLKILTGITNPTEGTATIRGRIGALLELGTGFHPELSGRDNIFLNGSFLGLPKWEIQEKLEEIIDFSGIRHAIYEPVKHYSSGMTIRLAFSIAATLAPEVIFLDEVWAVGDMDFQKKAFDKIRSLISDGRTVMIVSHSLDTIASASTSCILLEHGRVMDMGDSRNIIRSYLSAAARASAPISKNYSSQAEQEKIPHSEEASDSKEQATASVSPTIDMGIGTWSWANAAMAPGNNRIRLRRVELTNQYGHVADKFFIGEDILVEFLYEQTNPTDKFVFGIGVQDNYGSYILSSSSVPSLDQVDDQSNLPPGLRRARVVIPGKVCSMTYRLSIMIGGPENFRHSPDIMLTDLVRFDVHLASYKDIYPLNLSGAIPLESKWIIDSAKALETTE